MFYSNAKIDLKLVIEKILDEGKVLNNRFSKRVVSELVMNIKEFREALKKCEEDASNPNNSLYMLQNFSNLLQVGYKTFRSLADTNFTDGMVAVRQSIDRIKREIDESRDAKQKLLKIDYFN